MLLQVLLLLPLRMGLQAFAGTCRPVFTRRSEPHTKAQVNCLGHRPWPFICLTCASLCCKAGLNDVPFTLLPAVITCASETHMELETAAWAATPGPSRSPLFQARFTKLQKGQCRHAGRQLQCERRYTYRKSWCAIGIHDRGSRLG